ncbi:MAG: DUF167 domain-containing protein [Candidatus Aenigmatarchaeota archaeon]
MMVETADGVFLNIKVKTNSPKFRMYVQDILHVDVVSSPDKNKANRELVKELKKFFGKEVSIVSGHKSREKVIFVKSKKSEVETLIKQLE